VVQLAHSQRLSEGESSLIPIEPGTNAPRWSPSLLPSASTKYWCTFYIEQFVDLKGVSRVPTAGIDSPKDIPHA
jgi:hypothetical protein